MVSHHSNVGEKATYKALGLEKPESDDGDCHSADVPRASRPLLKPIPPGLFSLGGSYFYLIS